MRIWFKMMKDNHLLRDTTITDESDDTRTHKIFRAIDEVCYAFDLGKPIWLDANVAEFKRHAKTRFTQDSFIMKQKLTIIGALVHQPPVWVLDEPMVGLDPRAAHILKEEMRKHCEKGNTVFFSTHVLEVAEKLCDEIAIIDKGRLVAQGTLEALRSGEKGASLEQLFLELTESEEKQA